MLSLLGLNFVGLEHDTDSPRTNTYPFEISHRGDNNSGIATCVLTLKQNPHFSYSDLSLSIRITFQRSQTKSHSFIPISISLPLFSLP